MGAGGVLVMNDVRSQSVIGATMAGNKAYAWLHWSQPFPQQRTVDSPRSWVESAGFPRPAPARPAELPARTSSLGDVRSFFLRDSCCSFSAGCHSSNRSPFCSVRTYHVLFPGFYCRSAAPVVCLVCWSFTVQGWQPWINRSS